MKFSLSSILLFLLLISPAFCQDIVFKQNGDTMQGKIIKVTDSEIRFSIKDSTFSLPKPQVFLIKYADGEEVVITPKPPKKKPGLTPAERIYLDSLNIAGRQDAVKYYKSYGSASTATLITSIILPPLGLVTAIGASSTTPKAESLNYPNEFIFENSSYARGYQNSAKKIKQKHVWTSFGLGTAISVCLIYMLAPLSAQ